jgi:hypothetical protein
MREVRKAYDNGIYQLPDKRFVVLVRNPVYGTILVLLETYLGGIDVDFHGWVAKLPDADTFKTFVGFTNLGVNSYFQTDNGIEWFRNLKFTGQVVISPNHKMALENDARNLSDIQAKAKEFFKL